jgi:xanthosine utilization system XapX-like protein
MKHMKNTIKRVTAGTVMGGALLFSAMGVASAAPPVNLQDGLVNVGVGNVTIAKDVNVAVAADIVAAVCGNNIPVSPAILGAVDQNNETQTFCTLPSGSPLTVSQNAGTSPGNSGNAPGNNR